MSFTDIYQISGSAMTAQTIRLNTVASNMANAESPASSEAQAYKARSPVFAAVYHNSLMGGITAMPLMVPAYRFRTSCKAAGR